MSNPSEARCPRCAAPLPPNAPEGLCPRCLGALNLATETVPTGADAPPASPQPPLTPAELAPHFPQLEILECLGRGGMGVVYKARQKTLNRVVALKLLAPERVTDAGFAERFTREAQALARLNHPNIVTIHDFGCTRAGAQPETGFYFLLMEFVDGVNLRQAMKAGRFTPEQALAIVPPVCEALQYAHEQGIVHRDIKPENLLLDKAGRIKIADFGIAKMLETGGAELPLGHSNEAAQQRGPASQESLAAGTPQYMAPEQRTAPQRTDHRADIYSLGVVLYELLTGELPGAKLQPPSRKVQIDVRLDEIVLRALETKPELRYATAAEFRTQVENITDSAAGSDAMRPGEPTWFKPVGLLYVLAGLLGWLPTVASLGAHVVTHHAAVMLSATGLALLTRHRWWRWLAIGTNTLAIVNYLLSHAMLLGLASFGRIPSGSPWPNDMGGVAREMARHAPDNLLILAGFGCGIWLLFRPDARAAFASQCFTHREHNVIGGLAVAALVGGLLPFVWPYLAFNPYAHLVKAGGVFGLAAWCLLRGGTAAAPLRLSPVWGISLRVLVAVVAIGLALLVGFLVLAGLYRSREATMMAQRAALAAKQQAHDALGLFARTGATVTRSNPRLDGDVFTFDYLVKPLPGWDVWLVTEEWQVAAVRGEPTQPLGKRAEKLAANGTARVDLNHVKLDTNGRNRAQASIGPADGGGSVVYPGHGVALLNFTTGSGHRVMVSVELRRQSVMQFGPVRQVMLSVTKGGGTAADLDEGKTVFGPLGWWGGFRSDGAPSSFLKWAWANGVDFALATNDAGIVMPVCLDMGTFTLPKEVPDASRPTMGAFAHVTNMWRDLRVEDLKEWDEVVQRKPQPVGLFLPTNFVGHPMIFQTRTGARGLLQMTEFTENPRTVTLQYKLLQPAGTPGTAARAEPQTNSPAASPITSSIAASDNSPEAIAAAQQRGIASATRDIQAGIFRILRYGILEKTDGTETDEETGFRVQWVAGSILSNQFRAEADAYNFAMRDRYWKHEHWQRKAAATEPQGPYRVAASATNATAMDFRALKVEAPPGLRDIRVHFQCAAPAGFGFEVCQDVTRGPYGEAPKSKDAFWLRTKWVGLNDPPVLVWTLPEDFTPEEVQAGAKQVEAHLRTMRDALRMLPTEAVSSFGKVRHREGWLYELVLRVKLARDYSPVQAADSWVVEGTVRDGEGKPVPDADIHVSSGAGSLFVTGKGKTGADGAYRVGFGPGISMSAGDRRGAMQAAIVHVGKPGFEEKELGTGGNLQMAWELTPQQLAGGWQPGPQKTFLPGKPLRVGFVLLPTATVRGTLLTPDGKPLPNREIVLVGDRLRPGSSIYASAKTDASGRFTFKDVSTQHAWSFSIERTPHHRKRTAPDRFAEARVYEVTLIADGDDLRRGDVSAKPKAGAGANLPAATRVATTEGKYDLAGGVTLVITAKLPPRGKGPKHFDGRLDWPKSATNPKAESFDVALSEGAPFAVGWRADGQVLWVACGGGDGTDNSIRYIRKLTIAGPGDVGEQSWNAREKGDFGGLPAELRRVFDAFIAPQATTNQATGVEDEFIRVAQQRLQQVRLQSDAGRAGLLDVIEAEGALAVAESRSDALKQAEARLLTASKVLAVVDKLRLAGRADVETVLQAKQRKLAAELEVQRLRAGASVPPSGGPPTTKRREF